MLPQHKLILLSLFASGIIGLITSYYIQKTGKKKNYVIILLLVSLLPLISMLRPGSYESGDLTINAFKTMSMYTSLSQEIFPVNWAADLNATYGYPLFNFTYPLPYYAASLFHFLGFSFVDSLKLVLAIAFIASGVGIYYFLKSYTTSFYAFIGAVFYLFAPYHLVDMHFRVDIGESVAFVFIPLIFLFAHDLIKKFHPYTFIFLSFSLCGLLLSHQAVSLAILPFWGIYVLALLYHHRNKKAALSLIGSIFLGGLLASFYVLPVVFELRDTLQPKLADITFQHFSEFLYSPWRFGLLFQGHKGELSFVLGYVQWIMILVSIVFIWKKQLKIAHKNLLIFSLVSLAILLFMMQPVSRPIWEILPLIKNFQFSYRLMSVVVFFTAVVAAIVSMYLPKKAVYLLVCLAVFSTILNWGNRGNVPQITDAYLDKRLPQSTAINEGLAPAAPKGVNPKTIWFTTPPKNHLVVLKGSADIRETKRITNLHIYDVVAKAPVMLQENTVYFPGWHIKANGKDVCMQVSKSIGSEGVMIFSLPQGKFHITITYAPTPIRVVGQVLTIVGLLTCLALASIGYKKYSLFTTRKN